MTTNDSFDRRLSRWLDEDAAHRVPGHLDAVLLRTVTTRQRPRWSSLERWLPVNVTSTRRLLAFPNPGRALALAALVVLVLALLVVAAGSRPRRLPPPFGLAGNGIQLVSADGDLYTVDSPGGARHDLVTGATWDFGATYSRDGSKFLFLRAAVKPDSNTPVSLEVADADGSNLRALTGPVTTIDWSDWSPDGRKIAFLSHVATGPGTISVVDVQSGAVRTLDVGLSAGSVAWRPPNGSEIVFRAEGDHPAVYAVAPDGRGLRRISRQDGLDAFDFNDVAIAPDGSTASFTRYLGQTTGTRLFLLDLTSGAERALPLPAGGQFQRGQAVFSPDGRSVAYDLLGSDGTYTAIVAPVDGSSEGQRLGLNPLVPQDGQIVLALSFVPDGSAIVAIYGGDPTDAIWWLPVDGSPGSELVNASFGGVDVQRQAR